MTTNRITQSERKIRWSRRRTIAFAGSLTLTAAAGCLSGNRPSGPQPTPSPTPSPTEQTGTTGPPTVARDLPQEYEITELNNRAISGGVPPDGIPSIDEPKFKPADDAPRTLESVDPVFGVSLNGNQKAYPQNILVWHEIVNDTIGGTPVAVTYCPLTGTAQGFYRGETTFGVSGMLINNNLVMYDRANSGWWPQILALGIQGPQTGEYLDEFQVTWTTWSRWRDAHPETVVLSEDTGHARDYRQDPYGSYNPESGYYAGGDPMVKPLHEDDRFGTKEVVIGARSPDGALAVPKATLRDRKLVTGQVNEAPYLTAYEPSLDTGYMYRNPNGIEAEYRNGMVVIDGAEHHPRSVPLERVIGFDAMWFAWSGYYPSTAVHP